MIATLTFNLPEEKYEYDAAVQACGVLGRLDDLDNRLRSVTKHDDTWLKDEIQKELEEGTQDPAAAAAIVFRRLLSDVIHGDE